MKACALAVPFLLSFIPAFSSLIADCLLFLFIMLLLNQKDFSVKGEYFMKILSVFMSVLLIFSLCFTATAAETDSPVMYPLGDATYDGVIGAEDARLILRLVVGLEMVPALNLLYSDCDFDGIITAADARLALRISVGLEENQSYAFDITESKPPKCSEEGHIKARCAVTGKEVTIIREKMPHVIPQDIGCTGKGNCPICGEELTAEIAHQYIKDYENDTKKCEYCGHEAPLNHVHSFASNHMCVCNKDATAIFREEITEYLKKHGTKGEGYYYISEYVEPLTFAVFYDEAEELTYAYCGFSVVADGTVVYYDFNYNFDRNVVEALMYTDDAELAYAYGEIYPLWVDAEAAGDAISLVKFDVPPELYGTEREFRKMMEGAVNDCILWLKACAETIGADYTEHLFADYVNVK